MPFVQPLRRPGIKINILSYWFTNIFLILIYNCFNRSGSMFLWLETDSKLSLLYLIIRRTSLAYTKIALHYPPYR